MRNIERIIDAYETALIDSSVEAVDLASFVQGLQGHARVMTLVELLRIRMERQFEIGDFGGVGACLGEFPFLADDDESLQKLTFEEQRLREDARLQQAPPVAANRFMSHKEAGLTNNGQLRPSSGNAAVIDQPDILLSQADWDNLAPSRSDDASLDNPPVGRPSLQCGEQFGHFRILCELGSGAIARVYLAQQLDLSERWVVLKVCARATREPHRLAELNHPHVVPIISLHQVRGYQVICMPYCGATTVEHLIAAIHDQPGMDTGIQGVSELLGTTVRNRNEYVQTQIANQPFNTKSSRHLIDLHDQEWLPQWQGTDLETVCCRLVLQIATGLNHAHSAGLVHCDIKPANLLIGDDGNARIVDFNVAQMVSSTGYSQDIGGTLAYMSPEQHLAFQLGLSRVGPPSDLYALGIVFYQLLTGKLPQRQATANDNSDRLHQVCLLGADLSIDPSIASPDCVSIIQRLLQVDPVDRYPSAAELVEDLQLHLASRPLRYAQNTSYHQRISKWLRRHPQLTSAGTVAGIALSIIGLLVFSLSIYGRQLAENQLSILKSKLDRTLPDAELLAASASVYPDLAASVPDAIGEVLETLSEIRHQRLWSNVNSSEKRQIAVQLASLARSFEVLKESDSSKSLSEAIEVSQQLDDAVTFARAGLPPSLDRGSPSLATGLPSESLNVAIEHMHQRRFQDATMVLDDVVSNAPSAWTAWLLLGHCRSEQEQFFDAETAYGNACSLAPHSWLSWYCRGLALLDGAESSTAASAQLNLAEQSFQRALTLYPGLSEARFNRALCLQQIGRISEAIAQLDLIVDQPQVAIRAMLLRSELKATEGDFHGAHEDVSMAFELPARTWNDRLQLAFACLESEPSRAAELLEDVIREQPGEPAALQTLAYLYMQVIPQDEPATKVLKDWIEEHPEDATGFASRAVFEARRGNVNAALNDISEAFSRDCDARVTAQVGSAYALLSSHTTDTLARNQYQLDAISLLVRSVMLEPELLDELAVDDDIVEVRDTLMAMVAVRNGQAFLSQNAVPDRLPEINRSEQSNEQK